ncbi:hypothetical protein [Paenibacillus sp. UNC451MF]|uniref:hypothetical protein n=1 Tax=Paenibacillus sp. UNC451MF TaxID=1449063 RepID=UPI00048EDD63|nr:hypothetical protein [Paenibacillus sp. UNC451MF]
MRQPRKHIAVLYMLLIILITVCVSILLGKSNQPDVRATWVWDRDAASSQADPILEFARRHEINLIYLSIRYDADPVAYEAFNRKAGALGIKVFLLDGDPGWVYPENRARLDQMLGWLQSYNAAAADNEKFSGVHFDIEPYNLTDWNTANRQVLIERWMDTVDYIANQREHLPGMEWGADFPFWLDDIKITSENGCPTLFRWMMERFDRATLMAYRDRTNGAGGILEIVEHEIDTAKTLGKKVIVGVETNDTGQSYTTFYAKDESIMRKQLEMLTQSLRRQPSFAGYAIHDYSAWKNMER